MKYLEGIKPEFLRANAVVRKMVGMADDYTLNHFGRSLTVTGVERTHEKSIEIYSGTVINPKTNRYYTDDEVPFSVHEARPCRGVDGRSHDFSFEQLRELEAFVNGRYQYDLNRPQLQCCKFHDVGKGMHLHFQVHPNTRFIGDELIEAGGVEEPGVLIPGKILNTEGGKMKSRKLWVTIIGTVLTAINGVFGIMPDENLNQIITLGMTYLGAQGVVDLGGAFKKS